MDTTDLVVDVVIPTRDRPHDTIEAAVSACRQTVPVRVLIVDDGSTRRNIDELRRAVDSIDGVELLLLNRNRGVQYARQEGLANSSSPYVASLDSDDIWHSPHKLARQLDYFDRESIRLSPLGVVVSWALRQDEQGRTSHYPPKTTEGWVTPDHWPNMSVGLFRREAIDAVGGFSGSGVPRLSTGSNVEFYGRLVRSYQLGMVTEHLATTRVMQGPRMSSGFKTSAGAEAFQLLLDRDGDLFARDREAHAMFSARTAARFASAGSRYRAIAMLAHAYRIGGRSCALKVTRRSALYVARRALLGPERSPSEVC